MNESTVKQIQWPGIIVDEDSTAISVTKIVKQTITHVDTTFLRVRDSLTDCKFAAVKEASRRWRSRGGGCWTMLRVEMRECQRRGYRSKSIAVETAVEIALA
jgi:hypothetical protein